MRVPSCGFVEVQSGSFSGWDTDKLKLVDS